MPRSRLAVVLTIPCTAAILFAVLSGCKNDPSSATGVPATITVTGTVITGNQLPASNAPVVITGRPATVTDANGHFTVTDVAVPYDVTVVSSIQRRSITYRGLSRSDPTLTIVLVYVSPTNSAVTSGTVSGGVGYPQPSTRNTAVSFSSPEITRSTTAYTSTSASGAFSLTVGWDGTSTSTGVFRALQWFVVAGIPGDFDGYGEKAGVALTAGGSIAGQSIAMTAVTAENITGTITVPAGFVIANKSLSVVFPDNAMIPLGQDNGAGASFTYVVPAITGATISLEVATSKGAAISYAKQTGILPGSNGISITLPDAASPILPVSGATNVSTTTPFSWNPVPSVVYVMVVFGLPGSQEYWVITEGNSGTIPDLTALGLGLPKGASGSWSVRTFGPFANIDAAAATAGLSSQGYATNAVSDSRAFTTAP